MKSNNPVESFGGSDSVVGLGFYDKYGQHDDRPLIATVSTTPEPKEEPVMEKKRPGEIRFGGMSFALPPPGTYPDIPQVACFKFLVTTFSFLFIHQVENDEDAAFDYYSDYGSKTVSDVYPNHPASQVYPNRPVSGSIGYIEYLILDTFFRSLQRSS